MPNATAPALLEVAPEPRAIAPEALAVDPLPRATALAAVALALVPIATELVPVALEASPIATLVFVAVAPDPPPIAMEKASTVAAAVDPVPRADVSLTTPLCIAVPATEYGVNSPQDRAAVTASSVLMPLRVLLLVFPHANSQATTQMPNEERQTIENTLFMIVCGAANLCPRSVESKAPWLFISS